MGTDTQHESPPSIPNASSDPTPGSEIAVVKLANNGDVYLTAGVNPGKKFLVSSAVLSSASSVFEAMFSGRYAEGQALSITQPSVVDLPDEDEMCLEKLLRILHFKVDNPRIFITPKECCALGWLCDKYNCRAASRPCIELSAAYLLRSKCSCLELAQLSTIAAMIKAEGLCRDVVHQIAMDVSEDDLLDLMDEMVSCSSQVFASLLHHRKKMQNIIKDVIGDLVRNPTSCSVCRYGTKTNQDVHTLMRTVDQSSVTKAMNEVRWFADTLGGAKISGCAGCHGHSVVDDIILQENKKKALAKLGGQGWPIAEDVAWSSDD